MDSSKFRSPQTYIQTQIRCLAESMCSIIFRDNFALQCEFLHALIIFASVVWEQHDNALLIMKNTSFNGIDRKRFRRIYRSYNKSIDIAIAAVTNPYFRNVAKPKFMMNFY